MAISYGSLGQAAILHDTVSQLGTPRNPLVVRSGGKATFTMVVADIAPANNKYMWTLWNANTTYDIVIQEIRALHSNITTATGVLLKQSLLRLAALTSGTPVTTIFADDPETDTLPASMSGDTASTSVTDGGVLDPAIFVTGEEMILAATAFQLNRANRQGQIIYKREDGQRGITLSGTTAANRGLGMKNLTSDTEGAVSYLIRFTVELTSGANS